jgi:hypothetical protein
MAGASVGEGTVRATIYQHDSKIGGKLKQGAKHEHKGGTEVP